MLVAGTPKMLLHFIFFVYVSVQVCEATHEWRPEVSLPQAPSTCSETGSLIDLVR